MEETRFLHSAKSSILSVKMMTREAWKDDGGGGGSASLMSTTQQDDECEEPAASWEGMFWNALDSFSSGLTWNTRQDTPAAIERRDCSTMDTTPANDLEQFLSTVKVMEGDARIKSWTKTTSFTEIPICTQRETWDCGES